MVDVGVDRVGPSDLVLVAGLLLQVSLLGLVGLGLRPLRLDASPVRLELGMRDIDNGVVTLARRLPTEEGQGKETIPFDEVAARIPGILEDFQEFLLRRAEEFRDSHTVPVDSWEGFTAQVSQGWALALHCGRTACEDDIKAETAATPRCIPAAGEPDSGVCVRCGEPSAYGKRVIFGKSY